MADKLDLFKVLSRLDQCDTELYNSLSDDERGELHKIIGFLLPKWMTGIIDEPSHMMTLVMFNEYANTGWHTTLADHPELQAKLLAACGAGKRQRHKFYKSKPQKKGSPLHDLLRIEIPDCTREDCVRWVRSVDEADIISECNFNGYQEEETNAVIEEYRLIKKRI